jgi:hypothetical protein
MNEQSPVEVVDVQMLGQTDVALLVREEQAEVIGFYEANTEDNSQVWAAQQIVRGVVDNTSETTLTISDEGMARLSSIPLTSLEALLDTTRIEAEVEAAVSKLNQSLETARIFDVGMETVLVPQPEEHSHPEVITLPELPIVLETAPEPDVEPPHRTIALPAATLREFIPVQPMLVALPELPKPPKTVKSARVNTPRAVIAPEVETETTPGEEVAPDVETFQAAYEVAGLQYEETTNTPARVVPGAATLALFEEPQERVAPGTVITPERIAAQPPATEREERTSEDQSEVPRQNFEMPQFVPVTVETIAADLETTLQRALKLTTRDDLHEYMAQRPQRDIAARTYFTVQQASQGLSNVVRLLALNSQLDDPASAQTTPVGLPMLQSFVQQLLSLE